MRGSDPLPPGVSLGRSAGAVVSLGLFAAVIGCGTPTESAEVDDQDQPLPTLEATVMTVSLQRWPTIVRSQGSLFADEVTAVGTRVAGRVAEVHVDLGDRVEAGDVLVSLEQEEFWSVSTAAMSPRSRSCTSAPIPAPTPCYGRSVPRAMNQHRC